MSMPVFSQALGTITAAAGQKLDFIGFDACLMSQLQVALTVQPYASYELAAEELVPGFVDKGAPLEGEVKKESLYFLTKTGKISRIVVSAFYEPEDVQLALVEASEGLVVDLKRA